MPFPSFPSSLHLIAIALLAATLSGCAGNQIRGHFSYDVRPLGQRSELVWPQPPEKARFRYVGELSGAANFDNSSGREVTFMSAMMWVAGLFENDDKLMLRQPQHGMTDDKGRVYVTDPGHNAVLIFDPNPPSDNPTDKSGGQLIVWSALTDGLRLSAPVGVTSVWNGDIAVSDAQQAAVFRLNSKGELTGVIGDGHLKRPTGMAYDPERGLLFVADTVAHDVKVYDETGQLVNTIGSPSESVIHLNAPTHLSFADRLLYVTDTYNSRIQVFDTEGNLVRSIGERGLYVGNLARPKGVAVGNGIVYVVESYFGYMLTFNPGGELLLGMNGTGQEGDRFFLPSGVWTDNKGKVYLADTFNSRVVVFEFLGDRN